MVLAPKPGLEKKNSAAIAKELAKYKKGLSAEAMDELIAETHELIEYQKREDSPDALATIPLLDIKDINKKAQWYGTKERTLAGLPVLHFKEFTNGIVYAKLYFDAQVLPKELIPYYSLLTEMLGSLNTENYSYGDLDNALNIHTGGFFTAMRAYLEDQDDAKLLPKLSVSSKAMSDKVGKLFELAEEIVVRTKYADHERLKAVLTRHQSRLDARVKQAGINYALTRQMSYYSNQGMLDELTQGLEYYWFVTDLVKNFDKKADEISNKLAETAALLFTRGNLLASVTCDEDDILAFQDGLQKFAEALPEGKAEPHTWDFDFENKNEGLLTASKVQYVIQGYDFKKLGYDWNGKIRVLNQVLSTDYLQTQIRVIGGAYGGFSNFAQSGSMFFGSYRDPNLAETLENYNATPEYLKNFEADEQAMTRYIIGTISNLDFPLTPSRKGNVADDYYFENTSHHDLQRDRDAVLATTPEDIKGMEQMVADILKQNSYCVYGNEEKLQTNKDLFKKLLKPIR